MKTIKTSLGISQVTWQFLLAGLLTGLAVFVQTASAQTPIAWANPATVSQSAISSTNGNPLLYVPSNPYAVGDEIFINAPTASNPFGAVTNRYYVIYSSGNNIKVATTYNGTAVNATTSVTAAGSAQQCPDWLTGGNWTGGTAPNSSSAFASVPGAGGGANGAIIINGNVTTYGLGWANLSSDLAIYSGSSNNTSLYPLTLATADSSTPKITCTNSIGGVIFLGNSSQAGSLKINGTQGLIFNSGAGGAITGSGTAATSTAPSKDIRVYNTVDWSGFSGTIQIERGQVSQQNGTSTLGVNIPLTVGNAQTTANNLLAGFELNGRDCTVDALNGTSLGRIYCSSSQSILKVGNNNGSGTYAGSIGFKFDGSSPAPVYLDKVGSGTQTISGPIGGTNVANMTKVTVDAGTLILSGINTYLGVTTVNAGKLVVSSAQLTTNTITVANGATLGVTASGTSQLQPATLTLGTSAASALEFNTLASTTTAPLKPGTVSLGGTVTVNVNSGTFLANTSYPLMAWTTRSGSGNFVLGSSPLTANLSTNTITPNTLFLNVTAVTDTWVGGTNGNWDITTTNWNVGGNPGTYSDGSTALFDDTATGATNINVSQVVKPGSVAFNNNTLTYSVTNSSGNYIGGAGSVSKSGTGMVTLAGANAYSGGTTLSAGQLNINYGGSNSTNSAIGTGALTISGGVLDNTSSGDVTLAPAIAQNWNGDFGYVGSVHNLNLGTGAVTLSTNRIVAVTNNTLTVGGNIGDSSAGYTLNKTGSGTLALAGVNTFSGGTTLTAGTIQAGSSTALGSGGSQLGVGILDLNGSSLVNSNNINSSSFMLTNSSSSAGALVGNSKINQNFTIGVGAGNIAVGRLIDLGSPLTVTKVGAGQLTFNGAGHNNLMAVTVNGGTAVFANAGGFTADRGVTLNSGTIKLSGIGSGGSYPNANLIGDNQPFTINGGTFDLNGWNETVATVNGTNGVILINATGTNSTLTIGGDSGTNTFGGTIQNGSGTLALKMIGTGIQTLTGLSTYTGGTTITNTATLRAGASNVFPTAGGDVNVASGTLDLNGFNNAINGLNGAGAVDNMTNIGAATLTVGYNGNSGSFSGAIQNTAGTLSLTKVGAGIQSLSGTSSYSGSTTVSNGTLVIGSSLTGSGAVTVYGPGVLNTTNSPTITGAVTLSGTNATLSLLDGAIGSLALSGNLTLTSSNILKFDIGTSSVDQITVSGTFVQSGTTRIYINQVNAPDANTYTLITAPSGINASQFVLGNSLSGYSLSLSSDGSHLFLTVALNAPASAYWDNRVGTAWNGHSGANYNWDTDQSSGLNVATYPAASSDVFFAAGGASSFATTLGADFILKSLTFNVANNVTIAGANTLQLNGALTVNSGAGSNTISAGSLVLGVDQTITVADSGNTLTISSPISGGHALAVSGAGTVALSGSSTYTGNTTINAGTLALNNATNTLPDSGAVNVNGGTLSIGTNNDTVGAVTLTSGNITGMSGVLKGSSYNMQSGTISANLGGTAALTMTGSGSVMLASNSTYSGGTTITSGTLQLGASNALGSGSVTIGANILDLDGQTIPNVINFNGTGTLENNGASDAAVTVNANVTSSFTIDTTGGNITTARLVGTGATRTLTVNGGNTLTFNGAGHNNLIALIVNGSTVVFGNNGGYSVDRGLTLNSGTVKLAGPGNGSAAPNANLINDQALFQMVGGTFDLNGWNETLSTIYGSASAVIVNNGTGTNSTLSLGADNGTNPSSASPLNVYSGLMQDGSGVLSITKIGYGQQVINGTSTYSGNTTINKGQLAVTGSGASSGSTFVVNTNGGLLFNDTAFLIGGLSGGGNVDLVNGGSAIGLTVGVNNASTTYSGVLSDDSTGSTLTKVGTGTLTLSGANTYTGLTTVSNGVLILSPNYVAGYNYTVNEGATLGVSGNTSTTSAQIGTLTPGISGSGTSTMLFTSLPVSTNAPMTVTTLSPVGGAASVLISSTAALSVGTYNLINYTSLTGAGFSAFALAPLAPGTVAHLANNTAASPKVIQLVVTAVAPQIWSGAVNTNWDINTTANWKLNSAATNYFDLSPVLFDDSVGSGFTTVNLVTNVQPSAVTVSNNTKSYILTTSSGSGINGSTSLSKSGTGTLTLVNLTNGFTGGAVINAGTVVLSSSTLGSSDIADNGSLVFSNGIQTVTAAISGSGTLANSGSSTVELSATNNYSGGTIIKSGTLQCDNASALGTGTITLGDGASANSATLQASPSTSFVITNPIVVAAGGSGTYAVQWSGGGDSTLSGNVALNSAVTLRTTAGGALFLTGSIISGGANPSVTIDGAGTTTKAIYLYGDNSSTFTGNYIVTNKGGLKAANVNALSSANTISMDSTATFDNGSLNVTIAGLNDYAGVGGTVADAGAGKFLTLGGGGTYSFSGVINNIGGIVKTGSGQQTLSGVNVNSGSTVVSNGTLVVNGALGVGAVTVAGGMLTGSGTLKGATTVQSGTLSPGISGIGTLAISNALTLLSGGNLAVDINKTTATQDQIVGLTTVTYGGTLAVNNLAGTLTTSDSFKLFSAGTYVGTFASITPATPATGLTWNTNTLAIDGTLRIASGVNTNPTNITAIVSGNVLQLSWPADHSGWRLLVQTNNLAAGISANTNDWMTVPGSTGMYQTNITMDPTKPTEFYRLAYP